ncbi:MAG: hypothetical protein WC175_04105 [Candidatus Dojkabacteria bacterium]
MRKTFRSHPDIVLGRVVKNYAAVYWDDENIISLSNIDYPDVVYSLIHELAHWSMMALMNSNERDKYNSRYIKFVRGCKNCNKIDWDKYNSHIHEKFAIYTENCIGVID